MILFTLGPLWSQHPHLCLTMPTNSGFVALIIHMTPTHLFKKLSSLLQPLAPRLRWFLSRPPLPLCLSRVEHSGRRQPSLSLSRGAWRILAATTRSSEKEPNPAAARLQRSDLGGQRSTEVDPSGHHQIQRGGARIRRGATRSSGSAAPTAGSRPP